MKPSVGIKQIRHKTGKFVLLTSQREALQNVSNSFAHKSWEEWYNRTYSDISSDSSSRYILETFYNSSIVPMVMTLFPEHPWKLWKFKSLDISMWRNFELQKHFFDDLWETLKITIWRDWYKIPESTIVRYGGGNLLAIYNQSLIDALSFIYPQYPWDLFNSQKTNWKNKENQKRFFDFVMKELKLKSFEDWYEVTHRDLEKMGGSGVLALYNDSPMQALTNVFPDYPWQFWKFSRVSNGTWNDPLKLKEFLEWASKELRIVSLEDWYNITSNQLQELSFGGVISVYGSIGNALQKAYPEYRWEFSKFREKRGQQMQTGKTHSNLFKVIQSFIPHIQDIYTNYPHPKLVFSESKKNVELDIFIPSLNLAVEYHGEQHYESLNHLPMIFEERINLDEERRKLCKMEGITLVEIPWWWDEKKESLLATLHNYLPEVFPNPKNYDPIPKQESKGTKTQTVIPPLTDATNFKDVVQ